MSGPARAGLFIYASDMTRLAEFYSRVLNMRTLHQTPELTVLQTDDVQLVVHAIPAQFAQDIRISSPPQLREQTALKFFFTVPSIAQAQAMAEKLGGGVKAEIWTAPQFRVVNAFDPEGNIFHLREPLV
ncbi:MAG TPA: VOC family protein [Pseudomonadales bacterium]|nr:VOC family protein [Pseudomonadales bacterium]